MPSSYYFDHAATTPTDRKVVRVMEPYLTLNYANPSSIYQVAREVKRALEDARSRVGRLLGAKPTEIVWTSGGTESVNLAIQGVLRAHPGASWVTSAIEHDAVLALRVPMERDGHPVTTVPVTESGLVAVDRLAATIDDSTVLVSLMMANNEIGTIQPVAAVATRIAAIRADRVARGMRLPLYLHTDACQAAPYLDLSVTRLGIDLLSLNGSKIYGPKGSGLLYIRHGVELEPLVYGGGQERGRRSGTENVAAAVGLATALELVSARRKPEAYRLQALRDSFLRRITADIPDVIMNGDMVHRLPNNLNFTFSGLEGQALVMYLDQVGVMASTGSACSSGDQEPSHVLSALGRSRHEAMASLRLTMGHETDQAAIDHVVAVLPGIVARLRAIA